MKKLLNTLYITNELCYLAKDGENILVKIDGKEVKRFPIHILEGVVCFSYNGISPSVIRLCTTNNVQIAIMTTSGDLCGRFVGKTNGNVYLRRTQYRWADDEYISLVISKSVILAKLSNSKKILQRLLRDHREKVDNQLVEKVIKDFVLAINNISDVTDKDSLRGIEGEMARKYFSCFNELILKQKDVFVFTSREKRPPKDMINSLLSYMYTILTYEIQSALEGVGLDSYVGFFHTDRPGRPSLALDIIEEFRAYLVDRFVISLINKLEIKEKHFEIKENGSVILTKEGKNVIITKWQKRKQEEIVHPFLKEKCQVGLLVHIQASLMARYIRGDIDDYPPFLI